MYVCKYPHLFSPIRLGDTVFRNRIFNAPVGYEYLSPEKHPLEETIAFYERKGTGGAATVNVGSAVADSKRGCVGLSNTYLDDRRRFLPSTVWLRRSAGMGPSRRSSYSIAAPTPTIRRRAATKSTEPSTARTLWGISSRRCLKR